MILHARSEIKEDAKKSLSTLLTEEKNLREDTENFSTKITKATDLVKKLRSISDAAMIKLSTITSEIYSIKSDKSDLEKRIKNLKQKIEVTQNQLANFNIEDDKNRFKLDKEKIINLKKLIQENNQLNDGYKVELEKLEKLETRLIEEKKYSGF